MLSRLRSVVAQGMSGAPSDVTTDLAGCFQNSNLMDTPLVADLLIFATITFATPGTPQRPPSRHSAPHAPQRPPARIPCTLLPL